jgi:LytS/YehU family sensor histidine kinase
MYAVNKFGLKSQTLVWNFTIDKPFWKTIWFIASLIVFLSLLGAYIYGQYLKRTERKLREKERINTLIAESEQKALRAQMNPHFIYNCLNSIQQFFVTNDVVQGNKYLTSFASLLRQTLQNSEQVYINLQQECKYITTYLDLEMLRFKNKFTYTIRVDERLDTELITIPSMILQPFIENALRHGILNKDTGDGHIEVIFVKTSDTKYTCTIKDNGIGRAASDKMHALSFNKPESKGIAITKNRLQVINMQTEEKTHLEIKDIINEKAEVAGTEVIIELPILTNNINPENSNTHE